uniref:Transmembrane protein n=1 Tax=Mimivirus LCMiAC01 TaxID=2506608 RepID=A0A481Z0L7_9VIRU|nr:MAG: hypothetical protein LCMiAC01_03030 [Mimivirus LCMiAC01]
MKYIIVIVIVVVIGIIIGSIVGYIYTRRPVYRGPSSNIVKKQIYKGENGEYYRLEPQVYLSTKKSL